MVFGLSYQSHPSCRKPITENTLPTSGYATSAFRDVVAVYVNQNRDAGCEMPFIERDEKGTNITSNELLANDIHVASGFVTPFAAAVAAELEEFGLSKQKIDEIMLRSAERFGVMHSESMSAFYQHKADATDKSTDYLEWLKSAGGQAYDFVASVVEKHGPDLVDKLAPIVVDALQKALSDHMKSAAEPIKGAEPKEAQARGRPRQTSRPRPPT
jgi:hypothetical protein